MALGLVPAGIAALILIGALVGAAFGVPVVVDWATPFADRWPDPWPTVLRTALSGALFVGAVLLCSVVFVALSLALGEPFFERIWAAVERAEGGDAADSGYGFWRGVGDGLRLVAAGVGASLVAGVLGLVPVIGAVLGPVVGVLLAGRVLADELTSRAFTHRGFTRAERKRITRPYRGRMAGFGAATQLLMLVPLLPIIVMPTAVAGATSLARRMLETAAASPAPIAPDPDTSSR